MSPETLKWNKVIGFGPKIFKDLLHMQVALRVFVITLLFYSLITLPVLATPSLAGDVSIPPGYSTEIIYVKFREGVNINVPGDLLPVDLRHSIDSITKLFSLPEERLNRLKAEGAQRLSRKGLIQAANSLPNLNLWFMIKLKPGTNADQFIKELRLLDSIELVEPAPLPTPPPQVVTPDFTGRQGYLDAATGGIDARYSWSLPGGNGNGITIYDVEYNWLQTHEDLIKAKDVTLLLDPGDTNDPPGFPGCPSPCDSMNREHGTAVLGELIADNDTKGVTGISWGASIGLAPPSTRSGYNPANAITLAIADGSVGDVILIEQQTSVCRFCGESNCNDGVDNDQDGQIDEFEGLLGPLEWMQPVFDAIRTATANGIVVVEAAGNGEANLDDSSCQGRFNPTIRDSGALIVGAGGSPTFGSDRQRLGFSSYGSRVNVQGWGQSVITTGYGDVYTNTNESDNPNYWYTSFSGTSSASPIVAGTVANLQGIALNLLGEPLPPDEIRRLLVETGSPQLGNTSEHIGPRPNLRQAINQRFLPNTLYFPLVSLNFVNAPDLMVECIIGTSLSGQIGSSGGGFCYPFSSFEVVIRNQGSTPVTDEFWVDVYFDPNPIPTGVNQIWDDGRSRYGLVWGVTAPALPLNPGDSLTLKLNDDYYKPALRSCKKITSAIDKVYT